MRLLILIFSFIPFIYFAQNSTVNRVGFQVGMNRMDFQFGTNYTYNKYALKPFAAVEFGINRTFFQNRFFPRISVGADYTLLKGASLQFGPQLSYSCSFLKVNKSSNHSHQFNELYGGLFFSFGNKIQFKTALLTGWQNERYYSTYTGKKEGTNTLGFSINFGMNYAF